MNRSLLLLCTLLGLVFSTSLSAQQITILNKASQTNPVSICQCDTLGITVPPGSSTPKPVLRYNLGGNFSATTSFHYELASPSNAWSSADSLELFQLTTVPVSANPVDTFGVGEKRAFLVIPCNAPLGSATLRIRNSNGEISDTTHFLINRIPSKPVISSIVGGFPNPYTTTDDWGFCTGDSIVLKAQTQLGAQYQWLNNGQPMPGETNDSLVVKGSGNYAVRVDLGACARDSRDTLINSFLPPTDISFSAGAPANANVFAVDNPNPLLGLPQDSVELCENKTGFLNGPVPQASSGLTYTYEWFYDSVSTVNGQIDKYPYPGITSATFPLNSNTLKLGTNMIYVAVNDGFCVDTSAQPYYVIVDSVPDASIAQFPFPGVAGSPMVSSDYCMKDSIFLGTIPSLPDPDWKYQWQWYDPSNPGNPWKQVWPATSTDPGLDTFPNIQIDTSLSQAGQPYFQVPKAALRFFRVRIYTETTLKGITTCEFFSDSVGVRWFPEYDLTLAPNQPNINIIGQDSINFCETDTAFVQAPMTPAFIDTSFPQYRYSYQWLTDSVDPNTGGRIKIAIPGATNRSYGIDTTGNYFVVINDGICTDTSTVYKAFVDTVPETLLQERPFPGRSLTNLNLCLYDSALVSATDTVLGLRPWDYQWQQLNPVSMVWSNLSGEDGVSLTIDTSLMRVNEDTAYFRLATSYTNRFGLATCDFISDSIAVVFYEAPKVNYIPGDSVGICPGDSILFVAQGNFTSFSWQNGQVLGASRYINAPGLYPVRAVGVNGCETLDTVEVYPLTVNAAAGPDQTILSGETTRLTAGGGTSYHWYADKPLQFSDLFNQSILVSKILDEGQDADTITLYVEVTNQRGCTGIDSLRLIVRRNLPDNISSISKAYNIFTPNGDGLNDVWDIRSIVGTDECKLTIMNRWGSTVFEDESFDGLWTGVDNGGNELPDGTYYYVLDCEGEVSMTNAITIIRNQ